MVHRRLWQCPEFIEGMILLMMVALAGCARASAMTPTPVAVAAEANVAIRPHSSGDTVIASGEIVPAQEAQLGFTVSGRVQTVAVEESDKVQTGETLVTLEATLLETDVAQAEAALAVAQVQLALLEASPRAEEIAAAEAQLEAAEGALAQATAQRDQLTAGATDAEIAAAQAQLAAAEAGEKAALIAYDNMAQGLRDWEEQEIILRLRAAEQGSDAAEAQLAQAEEGAEVQIRAAQAAVQTAAAQRDAAQAQLDMLQAGATAEEIAVTEAAVVQAEAALQAARAVLEQATLRAPSIQKGSEAAPFAGTITALEVSPGETVMPGQVVLILADLDRLQVETTDLSERDVVQVAMGQQATVYVEAIGAEIGGQVADIAPQASTAGGDVVYAVTIELDEQPPGLRWGMSVEVEIKVR